MPLQATSGAASYDAFGGGVPFEPTYIEQIFSTYLYTGNSSTQTITNGIDLAGKGGLVWVKNRFDSGLSHYLYDSSRVLSLSGSREISSNLTNAQSSSIANLIGPTSSGFQWGTNSNFQAYNQSGSSYASWTFRKQPNFFDVVTYTGNGSTGRQILHSLGSAPGCIIIKKTSAVGSWIVYHQSLGTTKYLALESTSGAPNFSAINTVTSTYFVSDNQNDSGGTYVAYLFAHNAGGFGESGTDNVISCGSYTGNGSATGPVIDLGYEPQWLMIKNASGTGNWNIIDNMRGMPVGSADATLQANLSNAESSVDYVSPTATGFQVVSTSTEVNTNASTYIYIAIRRGPMKVPETGTSVFGLNARTGTGANATVTGSAGVSDAVLIKNRGSAVVVDLFASRLTGTGYLVTLTTAAELTAGTTILQANPWDVMDGVKVGTTSTITNASSNTYINYLFDRAPGFMDVVCYTGTGVVRTVAHNLAAVPELMIVKRRNVNAGWVVYSDPVGPTKYQYLHTTQAAALYPSTWNNTAPTASVFTVGTDLETNASTGTFVAYLFASCPGVSKVGSYTGNGSSQTINCGFTGGARFVLIKRTDSTGDWYVWDTARGIVAGNDPHLSMNTTAAEVTTDDTIDTDSTGFVVNQVAATNVNVNAASYIFLAIA